MIKRTIEISRDRVHVSLRLGQLRLERDGETVGSIPCEDIGVVVVDHPETTYTHAALASLADAGATVILCGRTHQPNAILLPLSDHSEVVWRISDQLAVSKPVRKQLWRQLIQAKIREQARNLKSGNARTKLLLLAAKVKSGDITNIEAQAARVYWRHWLNNADFRRDPALPGVNAFLNYGYAVVRAAIARSIVAAGFMPALGLHHCNRSNAFCLADDLIEPLRPMVDERVRAMHGNGCEELTQDAKAQLLQLLAERVRMNDETGPLMVSIQRMVSSLVRCYQGETKLLEIPHRIKTSPDDSNNCVEALKELT